MIWMAVLSPYGYLLIFLAIQLAPSDSSQITIQFGAYDQMILSRNEPGEWIRTDYNTVVPVSFKVDGTNLIMRGPEDKTESMDLAKEFKITDKEKWREGKKIEPVKSEGEWIRLQLSDKKLIAEVTIADKKFQFRNYLD